jgi:hypothetical protein
LKKTLAALLVATGLVLLAAGPAAAQCVMCKTALTGSPEGRGMGAQFNHAILLMVGAPYLVAGGFLLGVYRERIRHDARRLAARLGARLRTRKPAPVLRVGR